MISLMSFCWTMGYRTQRALQRRPMAPAPGVLWAESLQLLALQGSSQLQRATLCRITPFSWMIHIQRLFHMGYGCLGILTQLGVTLKGCCDPWDRGWVCHGLSLAAWFLSVHLCFHPLQGHSTVSILHTLTPSEHLLPREPKYNCSCF